MAGEYLQTSRYRVKAVVYKSKALDANGVTRALRVAVVYQDPPSFTASRYRVKAVLATRSALDINGAVLTMRVGLIVKSPHGSVTAARIGYIINQVPLGPPARVNETFEMVMQKNPVPGVGLIFSKENTLQNWQMVMQKNPVTLPPQLWSMTRAAAAIEKVLLSRPATPLQGYQYALSLVRQALIPALYSAQSKETTLSVAEMALVSLANSTPAVSMDYAKGAVGIVLMARPMNGLPVSPATTYSIAQKVLRRRPVTFPQSDTRVMQYVEKVLRRNSLPLGQSAENVPQAFQIALQQMSPTAFPRSMTTAVAGAELVLLSAAIVSPVSTTSAAQAAGMVLLGADPSKPFGPVQDIQVAEKVLMYSDISTQSYDSVKSEAEMALMANPMPAPGAMSGALTARMAEEVLLPRAVQPASTIVSTSGVAQAGLKWLLGATYPKPADMLPAPRAAQVPELAHTTLQKNIQAFPWSFTRVVEISTKTLVLAKYDTPEQMLKNGAFMTLVVQQTMATADYPSTSEPSSTVYVDVNAQQTLTTADDYPDKGYSIYDAIVSLAAGQTAILANDYPDKDIPQSDLIVGLVTEIAAVSDNSFPDKDLIQSQVLTGFISSQALSVASDYPDKDMVQSALDVIMAVEVAAISATDYPDKDSPQGALEVYIAGSQVMQKDESMYVLPSYPGRNKPMIFTTIVY